MVVGVFIFECIKVLHENIFYNKKNTESTIKQLLTTL